MLRRRHDSKAVNKPVMVEIHRLIASDMLVEIEADAVIGAGN